jgi:hypothetical protein
MIDYSNVPTLDGADNLGGTKQVIYAAPIGWFDELKGVRTTTAEGDSVTIDGTHTFLAGKGFIKIPCTYDTTKLAQAMREEADVTGGEITFEADIAGTKKQLAEFARWGQNDRWIVLVVLPDNTLLQVGKDEELYAFAKFGFDTGTLTSGRRAFKMKVKAYQEGLLFYEGVITLKP